LELFVDIVDLFLYFLVCEERKRGTSGAEMGMVRWMRDVKVKDRVPSKELNERLEVVDMVLVLQQNRLRWYGHVS